jgi:hypothetical protein
MAGMYNRMGNKGKISGPKGAEQSPPSLHRECNVNSLLAGSYHILSGVADMSGQGSRIYAQAGFDTGH